MVCGEGYDEPLYLPIDVTPNSGSNYAAEQDARFEEFADFLLEIDDRDSARLLVQQRYDAAYMAWEERISGVNAFYNQPDVNSSAFSPIRLVLKKTVDPDAEITDIDMSVEERTIFNRYDVLETGELRHGNANPGRRITILLRITAMGTGAWRSVFLGSCLIFPILLNRRFMMTTIFIMEWRISGSSAFHWG